MELLNVIRAEARWRFDLNGINERGRRLMPDLGRLVAEAFNFLDVPQLEVDIFRVNGVHLRNGRFRIPAGEVRVDLSIFRDGFMASTPSSTKTSDDFLTEVFALTKEYFEVESDPEIIYANTYTSELNFHSDLELDSMNDTWAMFVGRLSELTGAQDNCRLSSVRFCSNPYTGFWDFIVERKIEAAFDRQYWYSRANMQTAAHLSLLEEFEQLLLRT